MRILVIVGWLLAPVALAAYHYGPGQEQLRLDEVASLLASADRHATEQKYAMAVTKYDDALKLLRPDKVAESRRIRLERAKAQMLAKQLPTAHQELATLVDEMKDDKNADPRVLADARSALANAQYYMTWLMRLEGMPREVWEPEIEAARQTYRLLADQAASAGDEKTATRNREDLESAVRLARMELGELQGLRLPSQCNGCCSGNCNGKGKGQGKGKGRGPNGQEKKDARGAGSGPPPDGSGH